MLFELKRGQIHVEESHIVLHELGRIIAVESEIVPQLCGRSERVGRDPQLRSNERAQFWT